MFIKRYILKKKISPQNKWHTVLIIIGLLGLVCGYIWIPIITVLVEVILLLGIFVPIDDKRTKY